MILLDECAEKRLYTDMPLSRLTLVREKPPSGKKEDPPRLDNFLAATLPVRMAQPVSKGMVRKLIIAGAVYINGKRVRIASRPVIYGAKVDVMVDKQKLNAKNYFEEKLIEFTAANILFEDDDLIVVHKPMGLPTQPTLDKARNNLYAAVQKFLREREGHPDVYVGLHHRLDRDTSGLLLLTKTKRANSPVSDMFREHSITKTYVAVVGNASRLEKDGSTFIVSNHLKKDPNPQNPVTKYTAATSGGDRAETHFQVISRPQGIVQAQPITGRTHQIRVHLSELGFPILGDPLYGKSFTTQSLRLMLHAWKLEFTHPFTDKKILVEDPLPKEFQRT